MREQFQLNFLCETFHVMFTQQMSSSRGELKHFFIPQRVSFEYFMMISTSEYRLTYDLHVSDLFAAIPCVKFYESF